MLNKFFFAWIANGFLHSDSSFILMGAHINFHLHAYEFDGDAYSMPMRDSFEAH